MYGVRSSASKRAGGGLGEAFEDLGVIEVVESVGERTLDIALSSSLSDAGGGTITVARVQCSPLAFLSCPCSNNTAKCLRLFAAPLVPCHETNSESVSFQQTVSAAKSSQQHGTRSSRSGLQFQRQSLSTSTLVSSISRNMGQLSQRPLCSKCAFGPIFAISHFGFPLSPIFRALTNDCDCALFGAVRWVNYLFWIDFLLHKETS